MEREIVINERVDSMLSKLEDYFITTEGKKKPLQKELDEKVKKLMDEYDEKDEIIAFENIKGIVDYIALTINMPIDDEIKEKVIETLVRECEDKYGSILHEEV